MRKTLTPQPQILGVWRAALALAAALPAFLCSLFLKPGSPPWSVATGLWTALFLLLYLWYLPARLRALRLDMEDGRFTLTSGVLRRAVRVLPFESVQFASLHASPLHRRHGLSSLVIVAAGGRMTMPGLKEADARRLASVLFYREGEAEI